MSRYYISNYRNPNPYFPSSLSEINDLLGSMILWAPTFVDQSGTFPDRNIDSRFFQLVEGFGLVRKKLGEERYSKLMDVASRAKELFVADPDGKNGKTDQGRELLYEMKGLINDARARRKAAKLKDDEGGVTGD